MPRPGTPVFPPGALEMHRQLSEEGMPYEVRVRDRDTAGPVDPATGQPTVTPGAVHYTGRARAHPVPLNEQQTTVADVAGQKSRWYLRLPLGTPVFENVLVDFIGADPNLSDPALVGRTFRVLDHTPRTFGTELRVTIREETVP